MNEIEENDAMGNILLGDVARATAKMVLEGYEFRAIMKSLPPAVEVIINGLEEGESLINWKRGE